MHKNPTVIITGANGFLGSALTKHFSGKGWKVIALVRNVNNKIKDINYSVFKLNEQIDETVFANTDYLIHCAYIKIDSDKNALENNIEGTKKLLALSRQYGVKKNIFISSMSAKENALSVYGKQKFAIEKLFSEENDIVIRPGLIIGNGGLAKSIIERIKKNKFIPLIDGGKQPLQTVYIYDLVSAIDMLITKNKQGKYTIAEQEAVSYKNFCISIASKLNMKKIFISTPYELTYFAVRFFNFIGINLSISRDSVLGLKTLKSSDVTKEVDEIAIPIKKYNESLDLLLDAKNI